MKGLPDLLDLDSLAAAYHDDGLTPGELVTALLARAQEFSHHNIFIHLSNLDELAPLISRLESVDPASLPLYGVPFLVKDNIDVEGMPTTAACSAFSYEPTKSAHVVQLLMSAGAIPLGKTNMDQFATGLVGTRSPEWGVCRNSLDPDWISGGSSAGSAVGVALGLATFSLGTDTAGSGRVPAMLNNIFGLKPSRGLLGMSGVVPACRSLDCPSIFALMATDARRVFDVVARRDPNDPWARVNPFKNTARGAALPPTPLKIAVPMPNQREFFGDSANAECFRDAIGRFGELGTEFMEVDIDPLLAAARLLYDGPWVAERYVALESHIGQLGEKMDPTVRSIIEPGKAMRTVDAWHAFHKLQQYSCASDAIFSKADALLLPTAPTTFPIDELLKRPVDLNSRMGYYTNFMNLLDLCGVAIPTHFNAAGRPFGVTLAAPAFDDQKILAVAEQWQASNELSLGATGKRKEHLPPALAPGDDSIELAVCGAHLQGLPLNWQLVERGGALKQASRTSANYRFYALADGKRPGLVRDTAGGASIALELWSLPVAAFGSLVRDIPWPLGIGKIELEDGRWVSGFICEASGLEGARDITDSGSWRAFIERTR